MGKLAGIALFLAAPVLFAQPAAGPRAGTLVVTSGGRDADQRFVHLAGGRNANIVFIPTAASSLRSDSGVIWNPDEGDQKSVFEQELLRRFGLARITVLHTRDRRTADRDEFVAPLRRAQGVWLSGGNSGRLASAYLGTRVERELRALLARGGVIGGESAGAIIQGSYTVRGRPDKPVLMVPGHDRGFGFLRNVAIDAHLSAQKRENELITVVDRYPNLLGIGIDDDTGLVVKGDVAEVFGRGRVAIFDNQKHSGGWYYWLRPGDRLDLRKRRPLAPRP